MIDSTPSPADTFEPLSDVPIQAVNTYARLWQLETWLRNLVYVELRALLGDNWAKDLEHNSGSFKADKSLSHMPTPEMNALSYAPLSKLIALVNTNWECFAEYFPPQSLWHAKIQEISQIRHRVAHFRVGHADDFVRVKQFLRDVDKGFWRFCTSYNDIELVLPPSRDPIAAHFVRFDPLPWLEFEAGKWAQFGKRDQSLPVGLTVRAQRRPWSDRTLTPGEAGHLYDFYIFAQDGRNFDVRYFLERTEPQHKSLVHICLESDGASIRLTVPSILGTNAVIELVQDFYEAAAYTVKRGPIPSLDAMDALAASWPEYVLGPSNPLTFLDPKMPCSFFNV